MTILLAASELADFRRETGWPVSNNTSGTFFDANLARCSISIRDFAYVRQSLTANSTEGWFHCRFGVALRDGNAISRYVDLRDKDTGTIVIRIDAVTSDPRLEININGSLTVIGSVFGIVNNNLYFMDVHWRLSTNQASSPIVEFYVNGNLHASSTLNFMNPSLFTNVSEVLLASPRNGVEANKHPFFSEIVVADESTIDWRVVTLVPDGEGNSTDWSGTESTKVIGVNLLDTNSGTNGANDGININTDSTNQVQLFTVGDISTTFDDSELGIKSVIATARCRSGSSGPQNMNLAVRTGGTNFFSTNVDLVTDTGSGAAFVGVFNVWDTNPDTGNPWKSTEITAIELGVRSRA